MLCLRLCFLSYHHATLHQFDLSCPCPPPWIPTPPEPRGTPLSQSRQLPSPLDRRMSTLPSGAVQNLDATRPGLLPTQHGYDGSLSGRSSSIDSTSSGSSFSSTSTSATSTYTCASPSRSPRGSETKLSPPPPTSRARAATLLRQFIHRQAAIIHEQYPASHVVGFTRPPSQHAMQLDGTRDVDGERVNSSTAVHCQVLYTSAHTEGAILSFYVFDCGRIALDQGDECVELRGPLSPGLVLTCLPLLLASSPSLPTRGQNTASTSSSISR